MGVPKKNPVGIGAGPGSGNDFWVGVCKNPPHPVPSPFLHPILVWIVIFNVSQLTINLWNSTSLIRLNSSFFLFFFQLHRITHTVWRIYPTLVYWHLLRLQLARFRCQQAIGRIIANLRYCILYPALRAHLSGVQGDQLLLCPRHVLANTVTPCWE